MFLILLASSSVVLSLHDAPKKVFCETKMWGHKQPLGGQDPGSDSTGVIPIKNPGYADVCVTTTSKNF